MAEPTKKRSFFSQKVCRFCNDDDSKVYIDFYDIKLLKPLISERGKIIPSRVTSVSSKKQRELAQAVKRARFMALLPYKMD